MIEEKCKVTVYPKNDRFSSFHGYPCGRKVKGTLSDGTPACGIHISSEARNIASYEKSRIESEERNRFYSDTKSKIDKAGIKYLYSLSAKYKTITIPVSEFLLLIGCNDEN